MKQTDSVSNCQSVCPITESNSEKVRDIEIKTMIFRYLKYGGVRRESNSKECCTGNHISDKIRKKKGKIW